MIRLGGLVNQKAFGKFEMGKVISDPFAKAFVSEAEGQDHEVSMAQNSLDSIIKNATELKQKLGEMEKNVPGWIQDHITNSENYIEQANSGYHELSENKIEEARGVNSISNDIQKVTNAIESELQLYKKAKGTPNEKKHVDNLKKLGAKKKELAAELDKKVSSMYKDAEYQGESIKEAKKYDIGSGWMGNGLTIWNRAEEQYGDYKIIAHISDNGTLSIRDKQLPSDIKKMFQIWADSMKKGNRPGTY
jgi:hypothetical protein